MRKHLLSLSLIALALPAAQAYCPLPFQAVSRNVVIIASRDDMDSQCRNVYQALSPDNPCELDAPSRNNIATNFYRASREYRHLRGIEDCDGTGPKTSKVMSCLLNTPNEHAFSDCLGISR